MILCVLLPEFPAVAARYATHPHAEVMVVSRDRVIARSAGLRTAELTIGTPVARARALAPHAAVIERQPAVEQAVWQNLLTRCYELTPYLQSLRPGLVMADVRSSAGFRQLLHDVHGQGGTASTRTMALLGAFRAAPRTILDVATDDIARFLAAWPVDLLRELDIEGETIDKMKLFGMTTLGMLRMLTRRHLEAQFGNDGLRVHDVLATISTHVAVPMYTPPPTIDEDMHFDYPQREPGVIEPHMLLLLRTAYERLGRLRATTIEVRIRDRSKGLVIRTQRILKRPAETLSELNTAASTLLRTLLGPERYCASIGVTLKGLMPPRVDQLAMFAPAPTADDVASAVLRRYPDGVSRARVIADDAYLPEQRFVTERWTPLRGEAP